jgi:hypothetical protein
MGGPVGDTARFLGDYIVVPENSLLVIAAWVAAAWLADVWDRFPHLCVVSPEKRCGKTTLLDVLAVVVPRPRISTNISPAALYRVIEMEKPTLLLDEAQSLDRRGSEASEVLREILNAGIGKNARVTRCGGPDRDQIEEFSIYSPKVFAKIGHPDGVLADRCLPIQLERKTAADQVQRYRSRIVERRGKELKAGLETWTTENRERAQKLYNQMWTFDIDNDRMAELLMPLMTVLGIAGGLKALNQLREYADLLEARDREQETQTPGVRLLVACRELFRERDAFGNKVRFLMTATLIAGLVSRLEEPWCRWNKGQPITDEAVARLLRPYGIRPGHDKSRTFRGYYASDFEEAWNRYLPPIPPETPSIPSNPSAPARLVKEALARNGTAKEGRAGA